MSFEHKTPPIKVRLDEGFFNLMLEVLDENKSIELDNTNIDAERLIDKLLRYPRIMKDEENKEYVSIGFYPREATDLINQFLAWIALHADVEPKTSYYSILAETEKNKKQNAKEE